MSDISLPVRFLFETPLEGGECRQACDREIRQWQVAQDDDAFFAGRGQEAEPGDGLHRAAFPRLGQDRLDPRVRVGPDIGVPDRAVGHDDP